VLEVYAFLVADLFSTVIGDSLVFDPFFNGDTPYAFIKDFGVAFYADFTYTYYC
jgi:hypothetical protein